MSEQKMQFEAPGYSLGELNGKLSVRVDSGKFMDTQYLYDEFKVGLDASGKETLLFSTTMQVCIVNGIVRDKVELENKFPELQTEFVETVATPIVYEMVRNVHQIPVDEEPPSKPEIYLG